MSEMLDVALVAVVAVALVVGLVYLYRFLAGKKQGYPFEEEIERALLPFAREAIMFAYKVSERAIDEIQERLVGLDKKQLAGWAYDLLPATIMVGKVAVPVGLVKQVVSREKFLELVQRAFDEFMEFYENAEARFKDELEEMISLKSDL